MDPSLDRYCVYLQTLTPETLADLSVHVTDDVHFKDPFNDVRGVADMERVMAHMFANVADIRFEVKRAMREGEEALLHWRFKGILRGQPWTFDGTSLLRFAADGRVAEHIDFWDAAQGFYERLPLIGWLLAALRRRLAIR